MKKTLFEVLGQQPAFVKTLTACFAFAGVFACFVFFSAAAPEESTNSQAIKDLSKEITKLSAELEAAKTNMLGADPYIGEIALFGGNFEPKGWRFCDGRLLSIAQNTSLFSLLGTIYGGNGSTTFALPDLRGRAAVGMGQGPGLEYVDLGLILGNPNLNLNVTKIKVPPVLGRSEVSVVSEVTTNSKIQSPALGLNYIIAVEGIYPSRW